MSARAACTHARTWGVWGVSRGGVSGEFRESFGPAVIVEAVK